MKISLGLVLFFLISCGGGIQDAPEWKGKIWAGSSKDASIKRMQDNESISTSDPKFDEYAAISYQDLSCIYQTFVYNCMSWKQAQVDCKPLETGTIKRTIQKYSREDK